MKSLKLIMKMNQTIEYNATMTRSGTKAWFDIKNVANLENVQPELTKPDKIFETWCHTFQD